LQTEELKNEDLDRAYPLITRKGTNKNGQTVHYYFNDSAAPISFTYNYNKGIDSAAGKSVTQGDLQQLDSWGFVIIEEI
jgi:beta-galactosidase